MRVTRSDIAVLAAALIILAEFGAIWMHPDSTQWDFAIYYRAARAHAAGSNPYDLAAQEPALEYLYPPITLEAFRPIASLDYASAARAWLILKLIAMIGLCVGWRRFFLPGIDRGLFALVVVLGLSGATLWDLRSGNVNMFEQVLLWSAFAAYLHRRYRIFTAGIIAAGAFKLFPLAFLLLLFAPQVPRRERWGAAAGGAVLLGVVFAPLITRPQEIGWFLGSLNSFRPGGLSPSILGFLDELARWASGDPEKDALWPVMAWVPLSVTILWMSRRLVGDASANPDTKVLLFASVIVYALCIPRFMIYTGMILLVPLLSFAWTFMKRGGGGIWIWVALALIFCAPGLERVPPKELGALLSSSTPLVLTLGMWVVLRRNNLRSISLAG